MSESTTIIVKGAAVANDVDVTNTYSDIQRAFSPGGITVVGAAKANDADTTNTYSDIQRVFSPGGITVVGAAKANDMDAVFYGDIFRICFVTLTQMLDQLAINIKVNQPYNIAWLDKEVTTAAWCWRIERTDGKAMGFTNHDTDIIYNGVTYKAATGFAPTAVATSNDLSVDNLDAQGILSDDSIKADDLRAGLYNNAVIEVFLINYTNLKDEIFTVRRGNIGEIKYGKSGFTAQIRGLMEAYQAKAGQTCQKGCRTYLGSTLCKVDIATYTTGGIVTAVGDDASFKVSAIQSEGYYDYGVLTWTGGKNIGLKAEIKHSYADGTLNLFLPAAYSPAVGDSFTLTAGCDGNASTCRARFSNLTNFRGEPYVMGNTYSVSYPASSADNIVSEGDDVRLGTYDWGEAATLWTGKITNKTTTYTTSDSDDGDFNRFPVIHLFAAITKPAGTYADNFFTNKTIQFTSGDKKGSKYTVKGWTCSTGEIQISDSWYFSSVTNKINIGDKFKIY